MNAALCLILVALAPQDAKPAEAKALETALEQARLCAKATVDGDYEKLIDMTIPAVIEKSGGKAKMLEQVKQVMTQLKSQGFTIKETTPRKATSSVVAGKSLYCIVPTTSVMTFMDKKITVQGFLLGTSSDEGKTWKFLDGSGGEEVTRKILPDVPKDLKFPPKEAPKIESNDTKGEKTEKK